jgi:hypothetical protein
MSDSIPDPEELRRLRPSRRELRRRQRIESEQRTPPEETFEERFRRLEQEEKQREWQQRVRKVQEKAQRIVEEQAENIQSINARGGRGCAIYISSSYSNDFESFWKPVAHVVAELYRNKGYRTQMRFERMPGIAFDAYAAEMGPATGLYLDIRW